MNLVLLRCLLFFVCLFNGYLGQCCINEYRTFLNGELVFTDAMLDATPHARFDSNNKTLLSDELHKAEMIYKQTGKIEDYSDYGAMLIYNGKYLEAMAVFQNIEKKSAGLYATASNIGTTYELLGQNDSAYYWINLALKINPNAHKGSEWIHLKVLEAKIKARNDSNYFLIHNILSLDFGENKTPKNINNTELQKLQGQLYHQLRERMTFIKPKDLVVGQLLFDLGNVLSLTSDVKSALQVYEVARNYGFTSELFDKREQYFKTLQSKADFKTKTENWLKHNIWIVLISLLVLSIAFFMGIIFTIKRFRNRKK